MDNRAYSVLEQKRFTEDDDYFYIEGMATTPAPDRVGDVVEPMGAMFKTPMPLILQHEHSLVVGNVTFAQPQAKGVPFKARMPKIKELGRLKERVDEAIQSVKYDLISAVSIGFRGVEGEIERLKSGGLRFKKWEWLELSLVTVPANAQAVLHAIKSLDHDSLTQQREKALEIESPPASVGATPPAAKPRGAVKLIPRKQQ